MEKLRVFPQDLMSVEPAFFNARKISTHHWNHSQPSDGLQPTVIFTTIIVNDRF